MVRLIIDRDCCLGLLHCGECEAVLPGLRKALDERYSLLISDTHHGRYKDDIEAVIEGCPQGAVRIGSYTDVD